MRSEGYCIWSVCVSVCYHYSGTTGYKTAKERYLRPQCDVAMDFKKVIFLKLLRSKVMAWKTSEKANMLISTQSGLPWLFLLDSRTVEPWVVKRWRGSESSTASNANSDAVSPCVSVTQREGPCWNSVYSSLHIIKFDSQYAMQQCYRRGGGMGGDQCQNYTTTALN